MPIGEAPPPPEDEVVLNAALPGPPPARGAKPAEEEEKPKVPPPQDKYDLMTPLELLEQVIIQNDAGKLKLVVKVLGLSKEEGIWRRVFAALKYDNMEVMKLLHKDFKMSELLPFVDYCTKKQNERAAQYLRGLDPDAEAEKKKRGGRRGKK
jgi:hypothetical protein